MTGVDGRHDDLVTLQLPRQAVRLLERGLKLGMLAESRATGGRPTPDAARLLQQLHTAAATRTGSDPGTPTAAPANVDHGTEEVLGMGEAAALLGCSPEYVRRLARTGHLRAHRVGEHGPWLTTPADLDAYRYGRQEATHGVAGPTPAERAKDRG